jgi:hypothetical protein
MLLSALFWMERDRPADARARAGYCEKQARLRVKARVVEGFG